jgi:hypothetical protein
MGPKLCRLIPLLIAVLLVPLFTSCPWSSDELNTLRIVNDSSQPVAALRVNFAGDSPWSGNWLPVDIPPGGTVQFDNLPTDLLDVLVTVGVCDAYVLYPFYEIAFWGGRVYEFTVTDSGVTYEVVPS